MEDIAGKIGMPENASENADNAADNNILGAEAISEKTTRRQRVAKLLSKVNRRSVVIFASVILIGGAIYLNWLFFAGDSATSGNDGYVIDYTGTGDATSYVSAASADQDSDSYFASVELSRQQARDEAIEVLRNIVDSQDALEEIRQDAAQSISKIANFIECEANIETLVCSKGFDKCVAVVNENSASIVVKSDGLLPNQVIQIKEIVCEQSGLQPADVRIIEMQ